MLHGFLIEEVTSALLRESHQLPFDIDNSMFQYIHGHILFRQQFLISHDLCVQLFDVSGYIQLMLYNIFYKNSNETEVVQQVLCNKKHEHIRNLSSNQPDRELRDIIQSMNMRKKEFNLKYTFKQL